MPEIFICQFASPLGEDLRRCGWNMKWWLKDENPGSAEKSSRIFVLLSKRQCIFKRKKWKKLKDFLLSCWFKSCCLCLQRRFDRLWFNNHILEKVLTWNYFAAPLVNAVSADYNSDWSADYNLSCKPALSCDTSNWPPHHRLESPWHLAGR